jgi:AcrR family transcriptional regulator
MAPDDDAAAGDDPTGVGGAGAGGAGPESADLDGADLEAGGTDAAGLGRVAHEQAVLDAATASLLAVGVRRTTLTDVARRARVSRMTVYRRWPDLRSLVGDVMTREWTRLVARTTSAVGPGPAPGGARAFLVDHVIATTEAFRANPLFRKIVAVDPELLLPYILDRRGATQDVILQLLVDLIDAGHADGSVRAGPSGAQARTVLLTVQSYVLSAAPVGAGLPAGQLADELRHLLDVYLAPTAPARPRGPSGPAPPT